jgi:hypothetical protein
MEIMLMQFKKDRTTLNIERYPQIAPQRLAAAELVSRFRNS